MSKWLRGILVLLCAMPAVAGVPEWVEVKSPHFSVITDAGEKRGREVALRFEQMRSVFGALMTNGAKVNLPVPLQIVAFRNTKELRQVAPLWKGKPTEMDGLFQGGEDRGFIMLDMSVENPWQVVFHEYGHQLMHGNVSDEIDPWFDEGFAEYFSSIEVDGKQARVGKIPELTYQTLSYTGVMKAGDLIRVQHNTNVYNESGDHRTSFYATSSMMVHYIYDNRLMPKVGEYFALVREQGKKPEEAFEKAFGMPPAQFDKPLRQYASTGRFMYYTLPAPADLKAESFTSKPYREIDARVTIADIHVHSPDYQDKARTEFEEILKEDPQNAGALRGLGYVYLRKRDREQARDYFQKAVERDATDPWVLYYSAMLFRDENGQGFADRASAASVMQQRLEKAVQLDPEFADAYSLLGYALAMQGKNDDALKVMIKAVNLNPQNVVYRFNVANVLLQMRNYERATAVLNALKTSSDPEVVSRADSALENIAEAKRYESERKAEISTPPAGSSFIASDKTPSEAPAAPASAPQGSIVFAKGKLLAVDCAGKPGAVMNFQMGTKALKLHVKDTSHVVVIGADEFSCAWANLKIAVNYRPSSDNSGDVVSLEVQ